MQMDGSIAGVRRNGYMGEYMDGRTDEWMNDCKGGRIEIQAGARVLDV